MLSSSGVATVSAITLGLAPGYWARTTTEGGATSGYSEIGSPRSAISPAISISTDNTPAKIGRSIKNLERFMVFLFFKNQRADQDCAVPALGASGLPSIGTSSGATSAPGRTRCKPLTTSFSPAARPLLTTRRPFTEAPSVTSR